ncbi:molybdopterin molybdotransferase MoeA [Asaia krungthepensis]|uniref:Molybdopterin molybdenumtransferase n=1 Tax=Asaia krungthepensis NRIC 0535 TaxID=1307925 RepID=A0ABQ0Q278_9PROT|nr:molybdopterin molybdotransferase MoeA [Asaia krungthepensis]GBQ87886.1 molybdopterin biosynthesis protein MoeA [Asaia krungthepensis NRIC 0535]
MSDLLPLDMAERLIREAVAPFPAESVPLGAACGRVLRQPIHAERALPPYDRVILDGIAVSWCDGQAGWVLSGTQAAGHPPLTLGPGHEAALAVMTGSVLPHGADTVIPREDYCREGNALILKEGVTPKRGQHIHPMGADCATGALLLESGLILSPPEMAVLAANGISQPLVSVVPSIGIISTGDELVAPDAPVAPWQIRRSNDYAIAASLARRGLTQHALLTLPDDLAILTQKLGEALDSHDVLVLSGGVSMGDFDFVPKALAALGVQRIFHKVAQRPGKPFWFGIGKSGKPVFALPGNPVSALACCSRHVVPALLHAQGVTLPPRHVVLAEPLTPIATMTRFVPVRLDHDDRGRTLAYPRPMTTSGDFNRLGATDGLVTLPPGDTPLSAGTGLVFHAW